MLRQSFLHIPGVGSRTEQKLWQSNFQDWDRCLAKADKSDSANRRKMIEWIEKSQQALDSRDASFFAELLPANQLWRLYPDFRDNCLFFDIETTGLGTGSDYVTTIATFDGLRVRTFVHGQNLDDFADYFNSFALIVSYNGKCFDMPFLRSELGELGLRAAHIDLRYVLGHLGYRGGLKACEQALGLVRPNSLCDVDGFLAVLLWREYLRGTERALESLLCYNAHDAVNLRWLMQRAYNLAIAELPIMIEPVKLDPQPAIDFSADGELIRALL